MTLTRTPIGSIPRRDSHIDTHITQQFTGIDRRSASGLKRSSAFTCLIRILPAPMAELASTYAALILADEGLEITADKINTLLSAAKVEIEPIWATLLAKDGAVLAVEKLVQSKLLVPGSDRRLRTVDLHIGLATVGLLADGRQLGHRATAEVASYKQNYNDPIPIKDGSPDLFCLEPSGVFWGYRGCAIGKERTLARTEIEKLKLEEMSALEAVEHAARIIHMVHDEVKDKDFELEMSGISVSETNSKHAPVPQPIIEAAEVKAKEALSSEMED
ncbi:hypothetical protein PtB15_5B151 [Puccinia triticina]|nr:hypothetical protein PtB15_5B151 [Puccinia triticina]